MIRKRDLAGMGQAGGTTTPPPIAVETPKVYSITIPNWVVYGTIGGISLIVGRMVGRRLRR